MTGAAVNAQVRFGAKGEVGINTPSLTKDVYSVENMNSYKIGPVAEFTLPLIGLGLDVSLLYSNEKMKVNKVNDEEKKVRIDELTSHYIDVPLNLKYRIGLLSLLKVYLAAGPYMQIKIAGDGSEKLEDVFGDIGEKKFQSGLNFGIGADIISRVQVGFNYQLKLTDDYSVNEPKWDDALLNNNKGIWSLTASVFF
jgi:hypothetical protein